MYVSNNLCTTCPSGTINAAGVDNLDGNTTCSVVYCTANHAVISHMCTSCPAGSNTAAGNDASGNNISCDTTICGVDEHVSTSACKLVGDNDTPRLAVLPRPSTPSSPPLPSSLSPITIRAKVTGSITLQGYSKNTFGDTEIQALTAGIANVVNTTKELVTVRVKDTRRRLLATITIEYEISTTNEGAAREIQFIIQTVSTVKLIAKFKEAGLSKVSNVIVTVSDEVVMVPLAAPPLPPPLQLPPSPPPPRLTEAFEDSGSKTTFSRVHLLTTFVISACAIIFN
jgi:hypothetical protein